MLIATDWKHGFMWHNSGSQCEACALRRSDHSRHVRFWAANPADTA